MGIVCSGSRRPQQQQSQAENRHYDQIYRSQLQINNDNTKTDQQKIEVLDQKIKEVVQTQNISKDFSNHLVVGYEQQKLQLLLKSNQGRQVSQIPHIKQQITVDNPEVLYYVLSENLKRDQGRSLLITPQSSQIGLQQTLYPEAENFQCYQLHIERGDYSIIENEKKKSEFIQNFRRNVSKSLSVPDDEIQILDITQGSIIVHFKIISKDSINDKESQLLSKVCGGSVEVYNYFAGGKGKNQLVGLSSQDFSPNNNIKWGNDFSEKTQRGPQYHRYDYYFPKGYKGFGLNVLDGKYGTNHEWIGMDGIGDEWRILFHGTKQEYMNDIIKNGLQPGGGQAHQQGCDILTQQPVGRGVYFSDRVSVCEGYCRSTQVGEKQFQLIFQSRVNPRAIKQSLEMQKINYFVVNNTQDIRPYRILLKEV